MTTTLAMLRPCAPKRLGVKGRAFTLVEVLVSMVILAMMMLIITTVISQAQRSWKAASSKVSQFREARLAFDTITRNLRQASIDTHRTFLWGTATYSSDPLAPPSGSGRTAHLGIKFDAASRLVSGGGGAAELPGHAVIFQAPLGKTAMGEGSSVDISGLKNLLCTRGYFVQFGTDASFLPIGLASRLQAKYRYRLYEYQPNTENNTVYNVAGNQEWATIELSDARNTVRPLADNILMLGFAVSFASPAADSVPRLAGNSDEMSLEYGFNSYEAPEAAKRFRLPRYAHIFMIAMDEESAARLAQIHNTSPPDSVRSSGATFTSPNQLFGQTGDLAKVRAYMDSQRLNYRIFNSAVLIVGSES